MQSLSRKVRLLEDSNEQLESRLKTVVASLDEASKVVDEHERLLKTALSACWACITVASTPYILNIFITVCISLK